MPEASRHWLSFPAAFCNRHGFIVVQHSDPKHESLLLEILAKKTTMAVSLASAGGRAARPRVRHRSGHDLVIVEVGPADTNHNSDLHVAGSSSPA